MGVTAAAVIHKYEGTEGGGAPQTEVVFTHSASGCAGKIGGGDAPVVTAVFDEARGLAT